VSMGRYGMGYRRGVSRMARACPGEDMSPRETPQTLYRPSFESRYTEEGGGPDTRRMDCGVCASFSPRDRAVPGPARTLRLLPKTGNAVAIIEESEGSAAVCTSMRMPRRLTHGAGRCDERRSRHSSTEAWTFGWGIRSR
jgi:hypothetical protein